LEKPKAAKQRRGSKSRKRVNNRHEDSPLWERFEMRVIVSLLLCLLILTDEI
jgi:hypothetical protein